MTTQMWAWMSTIKQSLAYSFCTTDINTWYNMFHKPISVMSSPMSYSFNN